MDTIEESRAASRGLMAVYDQIFIPQQENISYHRYTREFARYLYENFLVLMKNQ